MRFIAPGLIDGKISTLALENEINPHAARAAIRYLRASVSSPSTLIPSHRHLQLGDIILSRKHGRRWSPVQLMQRWHRRRTEHCSKEHCSWTHAMMYVGNLHVVESNKFLALKSGVSTVSLLRDCRDHEFIVLRYQDENRAARSREIVDYANAQTTYFPRRYDLKAVWHMVQRWRKRSANHTDAILCSEFVLECYALGGTYLVDDYTKLQAPAHDNFHFPADFLREEKFAQLDMRYLELELPPP